MNDLKCMLCMFSTNLMDLLCYYLLRREKNEAEQSEVPD